MDESESCRYCVEKDISDHIQLDWTRWEANKMVAFQQPTTENLVL